MLNKNFLLLSVISFCILSCTVDDSFEFDNATDDRETFEVQVLDYKGNPVKGVYVAFGLGDRSTYSVNTTDHNGAITLYFDWRITKSELSDGGFIQAIPNRYFDGAYAEVGNLDEVQVIHAPEKEEIKIELINPISADGLADGVEEDVSIRISSNTRLPAYGLFSSATSYDGLFQGPNSRSTYDCPPIDDDGEVNLRFIKTGSQPSMKIELRDYDDNFLYQDISLMP